MNSSDLLDEILGDSLLGVLGNGFFSSGVSVKTTVSYPMRFGWYYRPSTQNNEFWWGGTEPMVIVADDYLMTMPEQIIHEVGNALNAKGDQAYLD